MGQSNRREFARPVSAGAAGVAVSVPTPIRLHPEYVSVPAEGAFSLNGPYAASKAGLARLTRTLAAEGARKGARVSALGPGPVEETQMFRELGERLATRFQADSGAVSQQLFQGILQGRPRTTDPIAAAALFPVSDQSSAITGLTLNEDGGMAFY